MLLDLCATKFLLIIPTYYKRINTRRCYKKKQTIENKIYDEFDDSLKCISSRETIVLTGDNCSLCSPASVSSAVASVSLMHCSLIVL